MQNIVQRHYKPSYCRALRERVLAQATASASDDGTYKGMNNYIDHRKGFRREHTIGAEKGSGTHGPLRAPSNIRMTVRFDYQPDICKASDLVILPLLLLDQHLKLPHILVPAAPSQSICSLNGVLHKRFVTEWK